LKRCYLRVHQHEKHCDDPQSLSFFEFSHSLSIGVESETSFLASKRPLEGDAEWGVES